MKNAIYFLIFLLLSICLFSCKTERQKSFKVGVSLCNDDQWHQMVIKELGHEASFYPDIILEIKENKNGNDQEQIDYINTFIEDKVDLIVVSAGNAALITPVIRKAFNLNIPVVVLDQKIETEEYTAYIGGDNYLIGREAGLFIVNRLKETGNVVEIRGRMESLTDIERHNGFVDVISKYPGINLIAEERADFETDVAEKKMLEIIQRGQNIDIIFAMDDLTAQGIYKAYQKAGLEQPYTIGVDALTGKGGGIDNIINGYQDASFIYPSGADKVLETAYNILTEKPYQRNTVLYTAMIDSSNARLILRQKEEFSSQQEKTSIVNQDLNKTRQEYSQQRMLFYISILIVFIIGILLIIAIAAYRAKSRAKKILTVQYGKIEKQNKEILLQNEEIKRQSDILLEQKKQLEELSAELQKANDAKLTFFTNISHELKTPLSLITGPLQSLLLSAELPEESRYMLELANRNCDILMHLISQLLDFNKYDQENTVVKFEEHDLKDFLSGLNSLFNQLILEKNIGFQFNATEDNFRVWFDSEKIERVYLNILSNAFRFVSDKGSIQVTLTKKTADDKEYVLIKVYNSGNHIPEKHIGHIFERFYKVNDEDTGTGIGLALANTLVNLHKGTIQVNNENKGVTFGILLPCLPPSGRIQNEHAEQKSVGNNKQEFTAISTPDKEKGSHTVLLVEDNKDMRAYIKAVFQNKYKIIEAENGSEGLKEAKKYLPDIIISDIMMPGTDGLELCRQIKDNISTCHIPVILLTARSLKEHETEGLEHGADLYITKPFDAVMLELRVSKIIENRKKIIDVFSRNFINDSVGETLGNLEEKYINRIQEYVLEHVSDDSLDVDTIANTFGESYTQMYRKIKSYTGYTPVELIKMIRLKYARQLLNLKTKNIAAVAYESGFSTPSYFTRCFKEFYKESPSDYLKRIT